MNKETLVEVIALLNTANYDTDTLNHKRNEVVNTLKKQLSIYGVSKPFYCLNASVYGKQRLCKNQCMSCNKTVVVQ